MELINIRNKHCQALVSIQGAQLLQWQPHDQAAPILWHTGPEHWIEGKPIRGGIPLCWPWFGKRKQPSHGFARTLPWRLIKREDQNWGTALCFELTDSPQTRALWPHPFAVHLMMELGSQCHITLTAECNEPSTGALHSYFQVGDIEQLAVHGLGPHYQDALDNMQLRDAPPALHLHDAIDRIYTSPDATSIIKDTVLQRELQIKHQHHSDVVVWNPWHKGALALADMSHTSYRQMLCIETAAINSPLSDSLALTLSATPL